MEAGFDERIIIGVCVETMVMKTCRSSHLTDNDMGTPGTFVEGIRNGVRNKVERQISERGKNK